YLAEDLVSVLAEQRRAGHFAWTIGEFDRVADRKILAASRMIDLDHGAGRAQRLVFGQFLHRQDRPAGNIELVQDLHRLELGLGHSPLLDARKNLVQARQPGRRLGIIGMRLPARLADDVADLFPYGRLRDKIDVGVGIGLPALAFEYATRLAAAGIVACARHCVAEGNAFTVLAIFLERTMGEPLLVAQLDAAKVEHAVLHRSRHALTLAGLGALIERGDNA